MLNTNTLSKNSNSEIHFHDEQWLGLVDRLIEIFHITPERKEKILQNRVMKLTASIPFIAGCENPMRIALSHLSIYLLASSQGGREVFDHNINDNDDLFSRLERISHFQGGDKALIRRGMNMLALAMIEDHRADSEMDMKNSKYNPLNSGVWDYNVLLSWLKEEISAVSSDALDAVWGNNTVIPGYWDN